MRPIAFLSTLLGRLTLALLAAGLVAFAVIWRVASLQIEHERATLRDRLVLHSKWIAREHEERISAAKGFLSAASSWLPIPDEHFGAVHPQSLEACENALTALRDAHPHLTTIGLFGEAGVAVCSAGPIPRPEILRERGAFARALETNAFTFGGYSTRPELSAQKRSSVLGVALPIPGNAGHPRMIAYAGLDWDWLRLSLARAPMPPGHAVSVTTPESIVLAVHPAEAEDAFQAALASVAKTDAAPKGPGVRTVEVSAGGGHVILCQAPVIVNGAAVATVIRMADESHALASERVWGKYMFSILALGWGSALLAGWLGLTRVSASMRAAAETARRLRDGELDARCPVQGPSEVREVAGALNGLADSLIARLAECDREASKARASEALLRQIADNVQEIFWVIDLAPIRIAYLSPAFEDLWGFEPARFTAPIDLFSVVLPDDRAAVLKAMNAARQGGWLADFEFRIQDGVGRVRWARVRVYPLHDEAGNVTRLVGFADDVSAQKSESLRLSASLKEKEALLKEIHHRVKNNLQVVSSLLNLQARRCEGAAAKALADSHDRVRSMALIHELLYRSQNPSQVDFSAYAKRIVEMSLNALGPAAERVKVDWRLTPDLWLEIMQAVPLGLILNELVSNCFKHAFPDNRAGRVLIEFREDPDGTLLLRVADDGPGLSPDFDPGATGTLGMELVHALVGQIRGALDIAPWDEARAGRGASFSVRFRRA